MKNWYVLPKIYFGKIHKEFLDLKTRTGITIKIRNIPSTDIHIFTEIWLNNEYSEKGFEIKNSDVIIDIGAHIGLFTLWASQYCKKGKIICVEPEPDNFEILQKNKDKNKILNVKYYNAALSHKSGKIKLSRNEKDSASHSILKKGKNVFEINTITLKNIFEENELSKCDLLKLDCEGSEFEILLNLEGDIYKKIKKICLEYHRNEELKLNENILIQHLKKRNYEIISKTSSEKTGLIFAKRSE